MSELCLASASNSAGSSLRALPVPKIVIDSPSEEVSGEIMPIIMNPTSICIIQQDVEVVRIQMAILELLHNKPFLDEQTRIYIKIKVVKALYPFSEELSQYALMSLVNAYIDKAIVSYQIEKNPFLTNIKLLEKLSIQAINLANKVGVFDFKERVELGKEAYLSLCRASRLTQDSEDKLEYLQHARETKLNIQILIKEYADKQTDMLERAKWLEEYLDLFNSYQSLSLENKKKYLLALKQILSFYQNALNALNLQPELFPKDEFQKYLTRVTIMGKILFALFEIIEIVSEDKKPGYLLKIIDFTAKYVDALEILAKKYIDQFGLKISRDPKNDAETSLRVVKLGKEKAISCYITAIEASLKFYHFYTEREKIFHLVHIVQNIFEILNLETEEKKLYRTKGLTYLKNLLKLYFRLNQLESRDAFFLGKTQKELLDLLIFFLKSDFTIDQTSELVDEFVGLLDFQQQLKFFYESIDQLTWFYHNMNIDEKAKTKDKVFLLVTKLNIAFQNFFSNSDMDEIFSQKIQDDLVFIRELLFELKILDDTLSAKLDAMIGKCNPRRSIFRR